MAESKKRTEAPPVEPDAPTQPTSKRRVDDIAIEEPPVDRRLNLSVLKRKYVPGGTLLASRKKLITAMAVPSKAKKFIQFDISTDGVAAKVGSITEQEFMAANQIVDRMNVRASLATDKTITPARLSSNTNSVKMIKDKEPEEPEEKVEEKVEEETKDETKEEEITLDTSEVEDAIDQHEATSADKMAIDDDIEDDIVDDSPGDSIVPVETKGINYDDPLTQVSILTDYTTQLRKEMRTEPDLDRRKRQLDELLTLVKQIKDIEAQDSRSVTIERIEVEESVALDNENKQVKKNTIKQQQKLKDAVDAPENKLAEGTIAQVEPMDVSSGMHADVDMEDQVDPVHVNAADEEVMDEKDIIDVPAPIDTDTNMEDVNTGSSVTLGADRYVDVVEQHRSQVSSIGASANAMEAVLAPMEVVSKAEIREENKHIIQEAKDREREESRMDVSRTPEEEEAHILKTQEDFLRPKDATPEEIKEREKQLAIGEVGEGVPSFENVMGLLKTRGMVDDIEDIKARKKVLAMMRAGNKVIDVQTTAAPTAQDLMQTTVLEGTSAFPTVLGGSGVGTPVFVPGVARDDLHTLMNGVVTITSRESTELKAELTPLWNEFKMGRMAAGVREMERMPTRIITAPKSSVKQASKIRADETQQDETFGNFMFWLIHTRLDNTKMATWRGMLLYSAALGYNSLTQTQVNWIITGHKNGDLDSNTDFTSLESELTDPLDLPLEVSGHVLHPNMVNSLAAQVSGNPEPQETYPAKNTSPSAAPIDNSIHPDGSTGPDRANRMSFRGMPSSISNIPDPRFSMRGGESVANVRIATIRNDKFDPSKSEGDEGYEPEFTTIQLDDIGAGSKDIGAHIDASVADRLLRSMPSRLYAPIHAQACDRYLGSINFQRLSMPIEKYMKSYSKHPWGPTDFQQMYDWNTYTMALYGQMLYAFVTDINMQRSSPVFDMSTPTAVGDEYMELNELLDELSRYQKVSEDRAGRVGDDGSSKRPVEDHIDKYLAEQSERDSQLLQQSNVTAISIPTTQFPSSDTTVDTPVDTPDDTPAPPPQTIPDIAPEPQGPVIPPAKTPTVDTRQPIISSTDNGVRRSGVYSGFQQAGSISNVPQASSSVEMDQRSKMYSMFKFQ